MKSYFSGLFLVCSLLGTQTTSAAEVLKTLTTADHEKVSYRITGNEKGNPIILLHGFPLSSQMWTAQVEALKKDFRVFTIDLRGAGGSKSVSGPFTLEMLVDDIFVLIEKEKMDKPTLVGFSMGGFIALRALERDQSRFRAVVLADTKSNADSNESKIKRTDAIKTIQSKGASEYIDLFLKSAVSAQASQMTVKKLKDLATKETSAKGMIYSAFALMSRTDTTAALKTIKIPSLILVGDSDQVTNLSSAQELHSGISGSQLKVIPNAGHISPVENPTDFNQALLEFLLKNRSL